MLCALGLLSHFWRDAFLFNLLQRRHGLAALELTGSRVAKDLPFYSLTFA